MLLYILFLLSTFIGSAIGLSLAARNYLRWRLAVLPAAWRDIIMLSQTSRIPLPASVRTPAVRRELILRAKQPSKFSNYYEMSKLHGTSISDEIPADRHIVGFLHPNANAGGGGERVLWAAVRSTLRFEKNAVVAIYTAVEKDLTPESMVESAGHRFGIVFAPSEAARIVVIFLSQKRLIEPSTFPFFTLLGQAIGSAVLAYEAISNLMPDVLVDTTGLAFSYPVVRQLTNIPVLAYVHYPFVQSDMLASLKIWSPKQLYWRALMVAYRWAGSYATVVGTNSSWTKNHIEQLWPQSNGRACETVYPPCDVTSFGEPKADETRSDAFVYVAQFRPEKRHDLVLRSFAKLVKMPASAYGEQKSKPSLIFIGSIRNKNDEENCVQLKLLAAELGVKDNFVLVPNAPWPSVQRIMASSLAGVNAMWNEHFGMGVVETMAAGLIPVVHASAGPLNDIVVDDAGHPGFFFKSKRDPDGKFDSEKDAKLSDAMLAVLRLNKDERYKLRHRAWKASQRFSDQLFDERFAALLSRAEKRGVKGLR